jgi:hypothetical protein
LKLRPEEPSGIQGDPITLGPIQFAGGSAASVNFIAAMPEYEMTEEGTYWFDVLFGGRGQDDRVLTRIPFTVNYQPDVPEA